MCYRCVHCSAIFKDNAPEVFEGCSSCKSKFFFYITDEKLKEILGNKKENENAEPKLSSSEKKQIEKDVRDIAGIKDEEVPIFLDFESIKILKPGKYVFDLQKLFASDKPRVYQMDDGKYIIDLTTAMKLPLKTSKK